MYPRTTALGDPESWIVDHRTLGGQVIDWGSQASDGDGQLVGGGTISSSTVVGRKSIDVQYIS